MIVFILISLQYFVHDVDGLQEANKDGVCLKVESLGLIDGNTYSCTDASLPVCCQEEKTFKCCQSETGKSIKEQILLWGFIGLTVLAFCLVVYLLRGQGDIWESESLREAFHRIAGRLGIKTTPPQNKNPGMKSKPDEKPSCSAHRTKKAAEGTSVKNNKIRDSSSQSELQQMPLAWF